MSESGRPLLFSLDETAYDDAAYLVDRTFERPYQFTGKIPGKLGHSKQRDARFFAVRPVIERESEYNRLNSSHYDSDSQMSFRREENNRSDEHSNSQEMR